MKVKITICNEQKKLKIYPSKIKKLVKLILETEKVFTSEVILHFVNEAKIKKLHKIFFNDPSSTDCISFPIDAPNEKKFYHILGEGFICTSEAIKFANNSNTDPYQELYLYVIHTVLHLIGYDDIKKTDIKKMRKKENYYMSKLKKKNS